MAGKTFDKLSQNELDQLLKGELFAGNIKNGGIALINEYCDFCKSMGLTLDLNNSYINYRNFNILDPNTIDVYYYNIVFSSEINQKVQFKLGCTPYVYKHNGDLWTDLNFDYSLYN